MTIKFNGTNTAANPSITGDDTDTGIVYGSDQIDFSTGGSSKVTLNGSNVGIGTNNPTNQLHVYDGTAANDTPEVKIESFRPAIRLKDRSTPNSVSAEIVGDNSLQFRVSTPVDDSTALTERMRIDSSGNVNIGSNTSANPFTYLRFGASQHGAADIRPTNESSHKVGLSFYTDGTQDTTINPTERMRITSAGYLHVGSGHGNSNHRINGDGFTQGQTFLVLSAYTSSLQDTAIFFGVDNMGGNTASCALKLGKNSSNSRSLNAGGTLNASGTDYAEYMTKASDFTLAKGDICGINAEGKLTNKFSESISFVVKSTDPSYVGGDTWGGEDILGKKPADDSPDLPAYELKMEAARKLVDRIAFSGQVPVNVTGTTAGQYIIPTPGNGDSITGIAKAEKDLSIGEYISSVGKVITLESDGRAKIIVKVC